MVERGNAGEALAIPFQQTARTYNRVSHEEFTAEETAILDDYFQKSLLYSYDPLISDPVKANDAQYISFGEYFPTVPVIMLLPRSILRSSAMVPGVMLM